MKVYLKSYRYGGYILDGSLDIPSCDIPHAGDIITYDGRGSWNVVRRDYEIKNSEVVSITLRLDNRL